MRWDILLFAVSLSLVTLAGSVQGGHPEIAVPFLAFTLAVAYGARDTPDRSVFVLCAGIPLVLTTGSHPALIFAVSGLLLGLVLATAGALGTKTDRTSYACGLLSAFPVVLLASVIDSVFGLALLLLAGTGLFITGLYIVRIRFLIRCRGETG